MKDYPPPASQANYDLRIIRQRLSPERFARYEALAGNLAAAARLYEGNMMVSAEFYRLLHGVAGAGLGADVRVLALFAGEQVRDDTLDAGFAARFSASGHAQAG